MFKKYDAFLVGYYGMQNSGDDALMYATAWAANNLLGCENNIVGLYGDYTRETRTQHVLSCNDKQAFPGQNRLLQYKTAIQSKRIIFGGGSVLHSEKDINSKRHLIALANPKQSLAVGIGIGPFNSIGAEAACSKFLNECGFVGVRDNTSLAIANCIAPKANVHKTFDLAPTLLAANNSQKESHHRQGIALTLCSVAIDAMGKTDALKEQQRIKQLIQLITTLYQSTSEPITLIVFNGHHILGDWHINKTLMEHLPEYIPVTIKPYNPNPIAVLSDLSNYKAILSMRLHGAILGYLANTPVISINYHRKCQGWCEDIEMPKEYRIDLNNLDCSYIVEKITQGISTSFKKPKLTIDSALKNSLANWSI